jgi:hypothetical protein
MKGTLKDQSRNLDPTAEALLCSWLYGSEYAAQNGGVMDFWDKQTESVKRHMVELVTRLVSTRRES